MAKAKFMNGEFSAKFKGKRKFVAEQMEAIKDYAARDDMQINICPVIQERPSEKKNTEEQITPTHFISGNLEHAVVAIYDNAGIPSFMHRFRKVTNKELFGGSDKTNAAFIIGDEEYDEIYISVYENCEINGKPYSLPMQKPWTGITNDEAARASSIQSFTNSLIISRSLSTAAGSFSSLSPEATFFTVSRILILLKHSEHNVTDLVHPSQL